MRHFVAVVVAVALLAGCTTTISGSGRVADSVSPSPLPPAHPSTSIIRVPVAGPYGDFVTADLCAGVSMRAFSAFGVAVKHGWQTATTCYIDVSLYSGGYLQLNTWAENYQEFDRVGSTVHRLGPHAHAYNFALDGRDCERVLDLDAVVLETHTYNVRGRVSHRALCGTASILLHQELTVFGHGPFPRRSLARHSLTRFDLCAVIARAHFHRIHGLAGGFTDTSFLEGAGCRILDSPVEVNVRIAFIDRGFPLRGHYLTMRGHRLNFAAFGKVCEVISVQGITRDGRSHEILDVQATGHRGVAQTCRTAEQLAARMADVARLR